MQTSLATIRSKRSQSFLLKATPAVEVLSGLVASIETSLQKTLRYYGEDPKTSKAEDLFSIIVSFSALLQKTAQDMAETERRRARVSAPSRQSTREVSLAFFESSSF